MFFYIEDEKERLFFILVSIIFKVIFLIYLGIRYF